MAGRLTIIGGGVMVLMTAYYAGPVTSDTLVITAGEPLAGGWRHEFTVY